MVLGSKKKKRKKDTAVFDRTSHQLAHKDHQRSAEACKVERFKWILCLFCDEGPRGEWLQVG